MHANLYKLQIKSLAKKNYEFRMRWERGAGDLYVVYCVYTSEINFGMHSTTKKLKIFGYLYRYCTHNNMKTRYAF